DRIDSVIALLSTMSSDHAVGHQCIAETLTLVEAIYGISSAQLRRLNASLEQERKLHMRFGNALHPLSRILLGTLQATRNDLRSGTIQNLIRTAIASLVLDFVELAQRALEDGRSDVAAVLVAAAFEDLMKKRAES